MTLIQRIHADKIPEKEPPNNPWRKLAPYYFETPFCHDDPVDGEQTIAVNLNQRVSANSASSAFYLLRNMSYEEDQKTVVKPSCRCVFVPARRSARYGTQACLHAEVRRTQAWLVFSAFG